jgi:hypothetical protein
VIRGDGRLVAGPIGAVVVEPVPADFAVVWMHAAVAVVAVSYACQLHRAEAVVAQAPAIGSGRRSVAVTVTVSVAVPGALGVALIDAVVTVVVLAIADFRISRVPSGV